MVDEVVTFGQELQERIHTILTWLEMRIPYVKKWDEMLPKERKPSKRHFLFLFISNSANKIEYFI